MPLWPEIGVKEGVECRKEKQAGARNIGGRMIIDKPAEEEAGDDADGDNGGDDSKRGTVLVGREGRHGGQERSARDLVSDAFSNVPEQWRFLAPLQCTLCKGRTAPRRGAVGWSPW